MTKAGEGRRLLMPPEQVAPPRAPVLSRRACLLAAAGAAIPAIARADDYALRPVHLVVPYEAGGGVDLVGRLVGERLSVALGQPVVIDNKPGAGSNIGASFVAHGAPDGYTLLMASPANAINVTLYNKMQYDTVRDLTPVVLVGEVPSVLIVNPAVPAKTLAEFVALAKAKPGTLTFGSGGNGASEHLAGALFAAQAGITMQHIPYRGGSAATNDLIGGQISSIIINQLAVLPFIKSGQVRALAVASRQRSPALPDVPTFAESRLPGVRDLRVVGPHGPVRHAAADRRTAERHRERRPRDSRIQATLAGHGRPAGRRFARPVRLVPRPGDQALG